MYYNQKTNQLVSTPPWGSAYYSDSMKKLLFADWTEVESDFIPEIPEDINAKLAELDKQYQSDRDTLKSYYFDFVIAGDTENAEEIKSELAELDKQYELDYKSIKGGE